MNYALGAESHILLESAGSELLVLKEKVSLIGNHVQD